MHGRRPWRARVGLVTALGAAVAAAAPGARGQDTSPAPATAALAEPGLLGGRAPLREFVDVQGRPCRVYERAVIIDGRRQPAVAIVCREPNGRWVMSR